MEPWVHADGEARVAARTAAGLVLAGALALASGQAALAMGSGAQAATLGIALGLATLAGVLWFTHDRLPHGVLVATTLAMVATVLGTDLLTRDAGGGAQVALLLPTVYAAAFLRPWAAWLTTGAAVVAELALTLTLLPTDQAVTDSSLVVVALAAVTAVLSTAGRRQRALVGRLRTLASLDSVTGVATRRVFEERLAAALMPGAPRVGDAHPAVRGRPGVGILVMDVDRFKAVNDAHGHPGGDAALVHVARLLRSGVRSSDTVARLGGDELAVLMPVARIEDLEARAEALRSAVAATPLHWEGDEVALTVSVGVAHADACTIDLGRTGPGHLYAAADAALYRAKREGRDRVVIAG